MIQIAFQNVQVLLAVIIQFRCLQLFQIRNDKIVDVDLQPIIGFLLIFIPAVHQHTQRYVGIFQILGKTLKLFIGVLAFGNIP